MPAPRRTCARLQPPKHHRLYWPPLLDQEPRSLRQDKVLWRLANDINVFEQWRNLITFFFPFFFSFFWHGIGSNLLVGQTGGSGWWVAPQVRRWKGRKIGWCICNGKGRRSSNGTHAPVAKVGRLSDGTRHASGKGCKINYYGNTTQHPPTNQTRKKERHFTRYDESGQRHSSASRILSSGKTCMI